MSATGEAEARMASLLDDPGFQLGGANEHTVRMRTPHEDALRRGRWPGSSSIRVRGGSKGVEEC